MTTGDRFSNPHGYPGGVQRIDQPTGLRAARQLVIDVATASGLGLQRCTNLALAVSEVATNAIRHGDGSAAIIAYDGEGAVTVDVHDQAATEIQARSRTHQARLRCVAGDYGWCDRYVTESRSDGTAPAISSGW